MLTDIQRLEIIRQVEKSNLSNEQCEQIIHWAEKVIVSHTLLGMLFIGEVDIMDFVDGEPTIDIPENKRTQFTDKSEMTIEKVMEEHADIIEEAANFLANNYEWEEDEDEDEDEDLPPSGYDYLNK